MNFKDSCQHSIMDHMKCRHPKKLVYTLDMNYWELNQIVLFQKKVYNNAIINQIVSNILNVFKLKGKKEASIITVKMSVQNP